MINREAEEKCTSPERTSKDRKINSGRQAHNLHTTEGLEEKQFDDKDKGRKNNGKLANRQSLKDNIEEPPTPVSKESKTNKISNLLQQKY